MTVKVYYGTHPTRYGYRTEAQLLRLPDPTPELEALAEVILSEQGFTITRSE